MPILTNIALGVLLVWNAIVFVAYAADKRSAIRGKWRIPEKTLLLFAACFGAAGAWASMLLFRHKTRKKKFSICVPLFLIIQLFLLYELWSRISAN